MQPRRKRDLLTGPFFVYTSFESSLLILKDKVHDFDEMVQIEVSLLVYLCGAEVRFDSFERHMAESETAQQPWQFLQVYALGTVYINQIEYPLYFLVRWLGNLVACALVVSFLIFSLAYLVCVRLIDFVKFRLILVRISLLHETFEVPTK